MSESAAAPSPRAFEQLYRRHARRVRRALAELGVDEAALDDATQEVFLVLARRLPEFDRDRSVVNWLWGIARGVASTQRRSARRWHRLRAELPTAEAPRDPEEHAMRADRVRRLASFLDELDESSCAIFLLSDVYAWSGPEIAARLDLNLNTVYGRLRTVRQHWHACLSRDRGKGALWSGVFGVPPAWLGASGLGGIAVGMATLLPVALPRPELPSTTPSVVAAAVEPTEVEPAGQGPIERADRARIEESDMHTIIVIAAALAVAPSANPPSSDADADEAASRGRVGDTTVYEGFEDDLVEGEHLSPDGGLILHRRPPKHPSLVSVRTHFVPELIRLARSI